MNHRTVESNGIKMHLAEDGRGPLVVLCHGWPESWYSWRHQLKALAETGYRVVAPDQRGYGKTDRPEAVEDYNILQLSGDIVGLVDAVGETQFYQLYFQEPGKAEAEFDAYVRKTILMVLYSASGDIPPDKRWRFLFDKAETFLDCCTVPETLPTWLTEADL